LLQREQYARLLSIAAAEAASNPVSAVLEYMRQRLSDPITVADLAEQVSLSPSAFSHLFRDVTGRVAVPVPQGDAPRPGPGNCSSNGQWAVARISKEVGYASVSHFIREFRGRFGATPRSYCDAHALQQGLHLQQAGTRT